jgi:hypothetical protein
MLRAQLLRLWRAEQLYILAGDVQTKPVIFFHARPRDVVKKCYTFPTFFLGPPRPDCKRFERRYNPQNRDTGLNRWN